MELIVLADNNTLIDRYLLGEPGLSLHLADGPARVLFDCGYSDVFRTNAARLGIDLCDLTHVALSHGHLDHVWGLSALARLYTEEAFEGRTPPRPRLVAHPEALAHRAVKGIPALGGLLDERVLAAIFTPVLSTEPVWITDRLVFLGEIPRIHPSSASPSLEQADGSGGGAHCLLDDSALAWRGDEGLVIVTGCSHAGIANIVHQARGLTGEQRLAAIVGGLHLLGSAPEGLEATVDFLAETKVAALYPCHCTSFAAKMALSRIAPVHEVGSGLKLVF